MEVSSPCLGQLKTKSRLGANIGIAKSAGGSAKKAKKAVDDAQDDEIAFKEEPELEQWDEI